MICVLPKFGADTYLFLAATLQNTDIWLSCTEVKFQTAVLRQNGVLMWILMQLLLNLQKKKLCEVYFSKFIKGESFENIIHAKFQFFNTFLTIFEENFRNFLENCLANLKKFQT
jgi:hypothetical protein